MTKVVKYAGAGALGFAIDAAGVPSTAEALVRLSMPVTGVDRRGKRGSEALLAKALENNPFEDYPQAVYGYKRAFNDDREAISESYFQAVENFCGEHSTA